MGISGAGPESTASTAAFVTAIAEEPAGAEAFVSTAPYEFWALAEAVAAPPGAPMPAPPVEVAAAEAEPVVLDAVALELAAPPLPR